MKTLIVDDEPDIVDILSFFMEEQFDVEIQTARDGEEAWSKAQKDNYDIILTDFQMPRMTGGEFIENLRSEQNPNKDTPVIIISAYGEDADKVLKKWSQIFVLDKPINMTRLSSQIKNLVEAD